MNLFKVTAAHEYTEESPFLFPAQTPVLQNMVYPRRLCSSLLSGAESSAEGVRRALRHLALAVVMSTPAPEHSESWADGRCRQPKGKHSVREWSLWSELIHLSGVYGDLLLCVRDCEQDNPKSPHWWTMPPAKPDTLAWWPLGSDRSSWAVRSPQEPS